MGKNTKKHLHRRLPESRVVNYTAKSKKDDEKYHYLFEYSPAFSFIVDLEGRLIEINRAALDSLGYEANEVIGLPVLDLVFPAEREKAASELAKVLRGEWTSELEVSVIAKDGSKKILLLAPGHAFIYEKGKPVGALMTGIDITYYKEAKEKLQNAVKMEALIALSRTISHDFNNFLTLILNYASILYKKSEIPEDIKEIIKEIRDSAQKAANLSKKLSLVEKQTSSIDKVFDAGKSIREVINKFQNLYKEKFEFSVSNIEGKALIQADENLFSEVIGNLVKNSIESMPNGGKIQIEINNSFNNKGDFEQFTAHFNGSVIITISDEGEGMDGEVARKALEPFFTTRSRENHEGLGLSIAYAAIRQWGGNLLLESEPNKGTKVTLIIPSAASLMNGHTY